MNDRAHLRGEGVEAARSHFQHPILPVLAGHSEVVHGTPEYTEGHPFQQELGLLCLQAQGPPPQPQRGQLTPVEPGREKEMCEQPVLGKECVLFTVPHPAGPATSHTLGHTEHRDCSQGSEPVGRSSQM